MDPGALDEVPLTDTFWIPTLEFRSLAVSIARKLCPIEDRGMWNKSKVRAHNLALRCTAWPSSDPEQSTLPQFNRLSSAAWRWCSPMSRGGEQE